MVTKLTNQVIKYLVYGLIVYTLFSYVPQKQLPITDIALMTTVIIISFVFLDILTPTYSHENFEPIIENLELDALEDNVAEQENVEDSEDQQENVEDSEAEQENIEDQQSGI